MSWWMEVPWKSPAPKRGDLIHSAVGTRRERTWIILRSLRRPKFGYDKRRFTILRARWWELEPEMRMSLFRSAQRNGGQTVWHTHRLPATKKKQPKPNFGF